jgi:hypothetical protein
MEEATHLGSEPQKSTFEVRGPGSRSPRISHPYDRCHDRRSETPRPEQHDGRREDALVDGPR